MSKTISTRDNYLLLLPQLKDKEYLSFARGPLSYDDVCHAIIAQYGKGKYDVWQHGHWLFVINGMFGDIDVTRKFAEGY